MCVTVSYYVCELCGVGTELRLRFSPSEVGSTMTQNTCRGVFFRRIILLIVDCSLVSTGFKELDNGLFNLHKIFILTFKYVLEQHR